MDNTRTFFLSLIPCLGGVSSTDTEKEGDETRLGPGVGRAHGPDLDDEVQHDVRVRVDQVDQGDDPLRVPRHEAHEQQVLLPEEVPPGVQELEKLD